MPIAEKNESGPDEIVAYDLESDAPEHEGAESEAFVVEAATLGEQIEAVHLQRPHESDPRACRYQEPSGDLEIGAPIFVGQLSGYFSFCVARQHCLLRNHIDYPIYRHRPVAECESLVPGESYANLCRSGVGYLGPAGI